MYKRISAVLLGIVLAGFPLPSLAEGVVDRLRTSNNPELRVVTRLDSTPMAYKNGDERVGYAMDLVKLAIREEIQKKLNRTIKIETIDANTVDEALSLVQNGTADIECGSTSITEEREKLINFSTPFFVTGTQLMLRADDLPRINPHSSLTGKTIGVIRNTTNEKVVMEKYPEAKLKYVRNRNEGLELLRNKEIDAFASDGILLKGMFKNPDVNLNNYRVMPDQPFFFFEETLPLEKQILSVEAYGCMVKKDDPEWLEVVNQAIHSFREKTLNQTHSSYNRWVFSQGNGVLYPLPFLKEGFRIWEIRENLSDNLTVNSEKN
ncbi:MAG: amino acid ABC transporter substrate-binding protein [Xenococcaceae cyanobacterium]